MCTFIYEKFPMAQFRSVPKRSDNSSSRIWGQIYYGEYQSEEMVSFVIYYLMNQVLVDKPNIEIYGNISCPALFRWTRIIFFQFFASFFFTYGVMRSYYLDDQGKLINHAHSGYISLSMFFVMCLCGQLTGAHANPIITLALMFTKGTKITVLYGIIYIISQFAGSFAGAAAAYGVVNNFSCAQPNSGYTEAQSFGGQVIGSFLFILFLLIVVNNTTTFLKSNFWNYILVPIIFYICRQVTSQINGLNPAMVLANQVFYGIRYQNQPKIDSWYPISVYWAYIIGPLLGCVAATLLFNCLYLPLFIRWKAKK